jgi:hypothetical protein
VAGWVETVAAVFKVLLGGLHPQVPSVAVAQDRALVVAVEDSAAAAAVEDADVKRASPGFASLGLTHQKSPQPRQVVRIDQVYTRVVEFTPACSVIRRSPESNSPFLVVGLSY